MREAALKGDLRVVAERSPSADSPRTPGLVLWTAEEGASRGSGQICGREFTPTEQTLCISRTQGGGGGLAETLAREAGEPEPPWLP